MRTGFFKLDARQHSSAIQSYFSEDKDFAGNTFKGSDGNEIEYFLNEAEKIVLFATPLQAANLYSELATLAEAYSLAEFHIIIPVIGKGISKQHITTFYKPLGRKEEVTPILFDSKRSDEQYFFSGFRRVAAWRRPLVFLARLFRTAGKALLNWHSQEFKPCYAQEVEGVASRIHYQ